jgi:hypothetical protein
MRRSTGELGNGAGDTLHARAAAAGNGVNRTWRRMRRSTGELGNGAGDTLHARAAAAGIRVGTYLCVRG